MIRKLRRKFICISMGMVGLVLLTLVCGLLITTVRHQETICAETLDFALSDRNPDSAAAPRFPTDGQKPPLKPDGFDAPRSRSFFVVQLSDEGEIESVSRTNLTLLDEDAETAVQAALARMESRWPGLVLPLITFLRSVLTPIGMVGSAGGPTAGFVLQVLLMWLLSNIPTAVLLAIYFACRTRQRRKKQLDKMNIQDLN